MALETDIRDLHDEIQALAELVIRLHDMVATALMQQEKTAEHTEYGS